ncbi:hypothetical protein RCG17_06730 [Neobacillus sp. PS3-12]|uniref:hypothetical protein n=1 Tax=Neobacillus sp. PS3-12 TaxID=3070677 RepID=UPI0027E173DA|nr:hypothetical protein [Neobacillus sp. PS3-12]WML54336.1 hypothetical protein RCG17_06730 [Neobacillus sp. PS3-12]
MNFIFKECHENEATHVKVLEDESKHYKFVNVRVGRVYELLKDDEEGHEGEDMIQADDGIFICSFSLFLNVKWLKISS